jgi:hypothetical protein
MMFSGHKQTMMDQIFGTQVSKISTLAPCQPCCQHGEEEARLRQQQC